METKTAARRIGALGHEVRLTVFRRLIAEGPEGLPAGRIAEAVGLPAPTLSFHLSRLAASGLITPRRSGREVWYAVAVDGVRELLLFLTQDCCDGRPDLCGLNGLAGESSCELIESLPS